MIGTLRTRLTGALVTTLAALALVVLVMMPHAPAASATPAPAQGQPAVTAVLTAKVCTYKTTHGAVTRISYSKTAGTTVKVTSYVKVACGSRSQLWETVTSRSANGAHYFERIYQDKRSYPHSWQQTQKWAWSKTGAFTYSSVVVTT